MGRKNGDGTRRSSPIKPANDSATKTPASTTNLAKMTTSNTKVSNKSQPPTTAALAGNRFAIGAIPLSEFSDETSKRTQTNMIVQAVRDDSEAIPAAKVRMPPIMVVGANLTELRNTVQRAARSKDVTVKMMYDGIRVNVLGRVEHSAVLEVLRQKKHHFYVYHPEPLKVMLRGLPRMPIDELREILAELNLTADFIRNQDAKKQRYYGLVNYLLHFDPDTISLDQLRECRYIDGAVVTWELHRPRVLQDSEDATPEVIQCRNCQRYGHSAADCFMPSRCMICAGGHTTTTCSKFVRRIPGQQQELTQKNPPKQGKQPLPGQQQELTKKEPRQLTQQQGDGAKTKPLIDRSHYKCANCLRNHSASYGGCVARKEFLRHQYNMKHQPSRAGSLQSVAISMSSEEQFPSMTSSKSTRIFQPEDAYRSNQRWCDLFLEVKTTKTL